MLPSTPTSYQAFLEAKLTLSRYSGFAVPAESIHPMLKPHQAGYWSDGVKYLRAAEQEISAPSLFDLCGILPASKYQSNPAHTGRI